MTHKFKAIRIKLQYLSDQLFLEKDHLLPVCNVRDLLLFKSGNIQVSGYGKDGKYEYYVIIHVFHRFFNR